MHSIKRLLGDTNKALLALGGLAGAIVAIYAAGHLVLSIGGGKSSTRLAAAVSEAKFEEAALEQDIPLGEYRYRSPPTAGNASAKSNASERSQPRARSYRLVADTTPASARSPIAVVVATVYAPVAAASATTIPAISATTPESGAGSGNGGQTGATGVTKEETPEEKAAREAKEAKEKEEAKIKEEAEAKAKEEAKAKAEAEAKARTKAEAKTREQVKLKEKKEREKLEAEAKEVEAEREARAHAHGGTGDGGKRGYQTFVKPPASHTPFHREGDARVLVGTGTPTNEVSAVLAKANAMLHRDRIRARESDADVTRDGAGSGARDVAFEFDEGSTGATMLSASATGGAEVPATTQSPLPSNCDAKCGLRPSLEHLIDESSNLLEAAQKVVAEFTDSRAAVVDHRLEPVGVTVDYKIDFVGFKGKKEVLDWSLDQKGGRELLPEAWWQPVIVKQIEPTLENTTIIGNFWAPIPTTPGVYALKLTAVSAGSLEESGRDLTEAFDS
jgi:hypothetical protein